LGWFSGHSHIGGTGYAPSPSEAGRTTFLPHLRHVVILLTLPPSPDHGETYSSLASAPTSRAADAARTVHV